MEISKLKMSLRKSVEERSLDIYFKQIKKSEKLASETERILAARIQAGDKSALNKLVEANLKFVIAVSKNYRNQGLSLNDLIGEGNLGLIKAAERFNGEAGCRFITYAVWWIRQGILIALADQSRFMNIAPGRIRTISNMNKASQSLTQKLGREPYSTELAEHLSISTDLIAECSLLAMPAKSLSRKSVDENQTLEDVLVDSNGDAADKATNDYLIEKKMSGILNELDDRKSQVLRMSYGIGGGVSFSLKDISEKLNLSKERIRQIKSNSMKVLQHRARNKMMA